jgi:hypothetical protein
VTDAVGEQERDGETRLCARYAENHAENRREIREGARPERR